MTIEHAQAAVAMILDNMAAAYAGHSQYPLSHVGMALQCHRANGGLALCSIPELAIIAAGLLARRWELEPQQEAHATACIREAMREAESRQVEHRAREARRQMRRPPKCEAVDFVRLACQQVIQNCELATGVDMRSYPALAGRALASAIEDGIVATRDEDDGYECTSEEAADFASGYLWPDRFEAGFSEESAVIAWIAEAANTCSLNLT